MRLLIRFLLAGLTFVTLPAVADTNTCNGVVTNYETVAAADIPVGVQNGTPTPTNPIEPVFYQQGDMVLRRVGNIADSYDATTGKITRRIGKRIFNGSEDWNAYSSIESRGYYIGVAANIGIKKGVSLENQGILSTDFKYQKWSDNSSPMSVNSIGLNISIADGSKTNGNMTIRPDMSLYPDVASWKTWLSQHPITVYYQLEEPYEETFDVATYCKIPIKIATTKYNEDAFAGLVSTLNQAITKVTNIVDDTVSQANSIGELAQTKQDRPADGDCPTGRKCLLVTGVDGQPHWYLIQE